MLTAAAPSPPEPGGPLLRLALGALRSAEQACARGEASLRASLRRNLHAIVAALLIAALVLGSTALAGLLAVRMAQEGRGAAVAARRAFPSVALAGRGLPGAWLLSLDEAHGAASEDEGAAAPACSPAPSLSDVSSPWTAAEGDGGGTRECASMAGAGGEMLYGESSSSLNCSSEPAVRSYHPNDQACQTPPESRSASVTARLPSWMQSQGAELLGLAQRALPGIAGWLEDSVARLVAEQNLTEALRDARAAYEMVQGPRRCTRREEAALVVGLARAEVALTEAREAERRLEAQLRGGEAQLFGEVALLLAMRSGGGAAGVEGGAAADGITATPAAPAANPASSAPPDAEALGAQRRALALDAQVSAARAAHVEAAQALLATEHEVEQASARLALCLPAAAPAADPAGAGGGFGGEVGPRLQAAYGRLWHGHVLEAFAELRQAAVGAGAALAKAAATADSATLPRLAAAALAPLRLLARLALGSVGSTAATAVMGGLGVLRPGRRAGQGRAPGHALPCAALLPAGRAARPGGPRRGRAAPLRRGPRARRAGTQPGALGRAPRLHQARRLPRPRHLAHLSRLRHSPGIHGVGGWGVGWMYTYVYTHMADMSLSSNICILPPPFCPSKTGVRGGGCVRPATLHPHLRRGRAGQRAPGRAGTPAQRRGTLPAPLCGLLLWRHAHPGRHPRRAPLPPVAGHPGRHLDL
ncbi:hypothetical protein QBZ16_002191 [Prototheca wickerhamii]|uniref:Uncharacterized protein n=1 Tax=Prototheca wickerhamii TaxID=3111 RepID=A0AAD9ILC5_PROWI|nr:hypothetical protein QBZ16_002191 [Prototheca wickerhamii]